MRDTHSVFDPVERDAQILRYFDFPKFCSMLQRKALFFCRADLLGDPLEGSLTAAMVADWEKVSSEQFRSFRADMDKMLAKSGYMNCWHLGLHESMAMWRGYGGDYGVAIQSTFGALDDVLPKEFSEGNIHAKVYIGPVHYIDHNSLTERIQHGHNQQFALFMNKYVGYSHESELRAIFLDPSGAARGDLKPGYFIPVDLDALVPRVVVSPLAPDWFHTVVSSSVDKFGFNFDVVSSGVPKEPRY